MKYLRGFAVFGLLFSALARAEAPPPVQSTELTTSAQPQGRIIGGIELRPSHIGNVGEFHTENWVQLGYKFADGKQLFYRQEFNTNLYDPRVSDEQNGLNAYAYDGSFRAKLGDLWKDRGGRSLAYEARLYLPTFAVRRDAGMLVQLRSYFKLKQRLSESVTLGLEEVPIVHLYDRAGIVRSRGKAEANPLVENRVYLTVEVTPIKKLKFFFPLILQSTRYRAFATGARNDDSWGHKLWIYPELTYDLSPQTTLGLAYYSDNLVRADFTGTDFENGFARGVTQVILSASL